MHSSLRLSAILFAAAVADEACIDEESSLLQAAKIEEKPAAKRKSSKPLAGLLESARGMLINGVDPESDVLSFDQAILAALSEDIIPALKDEGTADSTWLASEHARFQEAINELVLNNANPYGLSIEINGAGSGSSADHKTCRDEQHLTCEAKRDCEMTLYSLWGTWVTKETELREDHDHIVGHFCAEGANGTLHDFRVASVPWMEEYLEKKAECDAAEAAYDAQVSICDGTHTGLDEKTNECNGKQAALEQNACHRVTGIEQSLREFHTTWASLHASYQGVTDLVYNQTEDRHQEYKTLKVVECLLDRIRERNGQPCDQSSGEVDSEMLTCHEQGEDIEICTEAPEICPTYVTPPATPGPCGEGQWTDCLPPIPINPCSDQWENSEMDLPAVPVAPFSATNPGCNDYPDCGSCDVEVDQAWVSSLADYHTWVEPPASFALENYWSHISGGFAANGMHTDYADAYSLWGATVDGCSSDNSNSNAGVGDQSGQMIPLTVHGADEHAAVRCCAHEGTALTCASSVQGVCHDFATFHDANAICRAADMRLCTQEEMGSGVCCGTGCWFNHYAVWISDGTGGSDLDSTRYAAGAFRDSDHDFRDSRYESESLTMVDGCLNQNHEVPRAVVSSDSGETASVRCCSMDGSRCDTDHLPGGCQSGKTHAEAVEICAANGERLCTEEEIVDRLCCGTGCGFDGHQVWVSHTPAVTSAVTWLIGGAHPAQSCDQVCAAAGRSCQQTELDALNGASAATFIAKYAEAGHTCQADRFADHCSSGSNCVNWGSPYIHNSHFDEGLCWGGSTPTVAPCGQVPVDGNHRRLCPC